MKIWQAGLLIAGAALAGFLAVRLAEPPVAPRTVARFSPPEIVPPVTAPPVRWKTAPAAPADVTASAPPAVYTEPPAPKQPPPAARPAAKRTPFPERIREVAMVPQKPVPYIEPEKPTRHVTLEIGANIDVRFNGPNAVLERPVVAEGLEIAEKGARANVRAEEGNKLRLVSFQSADGQRIDVSTDPATESGNVIRFRLAARITITERRL